MGEGVQRRIIGGKIMDEFEINLEEDFIEVEGDSEEVILETEDNIDGGCK